MEKVYLVTQHYSCESSGCVGMYGFRGVYKNYEDAKKKFNEIKKEIKSYNLGYDVIDEDENSYCEYINGEYLYYHEYVEIVEKELL